MKTKHNQFEIIIFAVLVLLMISILFTQNAEYYDSFEYLLSARKLFSDTYYWFPKNIIFTLFCSFIYFPLSIFEVERSIFPYHIGMFLVSMLYLWYSIAWINVVYRPKISIWMIASFLILNRIFIQYFSFALPDIFTAAMIVSWMYCDEKLVIGSWKRFISLTVVSSLIALGRQNTILIPFVMGLVKIAQLHANHAHEQKKKLIFDYSKVLICSFLLSLIIFGLFFAVGENLDFYSGIVRGLEVYRNYYASVNSVVPQPAYVYLMYFFLSAGVIGTVYFIFGLFLYLKTNSNHSNKKFVDNRMLPSVVAGLVFFLFMMSLGQKEARYLSPLLPICALLQIYAIDHLDDRKRLISLLLLCVSQLPGFLHFADPFYRSDLSKNISQKIAKWSKTNEVVFLRSMAAFYPKKHLFHWNDTAFYIYHWSAGAFHFYTGKKAYFNPFSSQMHFEKYGFPIPDDFQIMAPQNVTMIMPTSWQNAAVEAPEKVPTIFAMRWSQRVNERFDTEKNCEKRISEYCLEIIEVNHELQVRND